MPAKAGIHAAVNINNFKNLDSRFRGNDGLSPDCHTVYCGRERGEEDEGEVEGEGKN
jgi:hypothetical protein